MSSSSPILSAVQGEQRRDLVRVRRALLSVFDKTSLLSLAAALAAHNTTLLSTGGTAKALRAAGYSVQDVSEYTGSAEILDGRVKTLHPKIHGALLSVRGNAEHEREIAAQGIVPIDLVVVNLYPFEDAVAQGADAASVIENIDIGGPCMLRAAAKNHAHVCAVSSPAQYDALIQELHTHNGCLSLALRKACAAQTFALTAKYDSAVADFLAAQCAPTQDTQPAQDTEEALTLPVTLTREYALHFPLKYGCNPHQRPAGMYVLRDAHTHSDAHSDAHTHSDAHSDAHTHSDAQGARAPPFTVLSGAPGYINLLDAVNAWQLVRELSVCVCASEGDVSARCVAAASFKHCSPAGAAVNSVPLSPEECAAYELLPEEAAALSPVALAYIRARNADPLCSFGDFAAVSHTVDFSLASVLKTCVCDGIIAPAYEPEALEILRNKKKGGFVVLQASTDTDALSLLECREAQGCVFVQRRNDALFTRERLRRVVCGPAQTLTATETQTQTLSESAVRDLVCASVAIKFTQSNSVAYAKNGQVIGCGAGQQSRVDCVKLAGRKAQTWFLRQHPKVLSLPFKASVKRQERINARVRYIEGDFTEKEYEKWCELFESVPEALSESEKREFMRTLSGVSVSSDAFFPFRDSIDHASKYGVQFVAQPGGSVADSEVIAACEEYGMSMAFTDLRLFYH